MSAGGRLIVFEGGEASGKSTQARLLAGVLGAVLTREPGGTPLGEQIRHLLLDHDGGPLDDRAELMLMLAGRAQHVAELIRPALESGRDVVCDRFSGSTIAYQGFGRGLDPEAVTAADAVVRDGIEPDLVVLLDLAPELAAARRARASDRIEREDEAFFARVRAGYANLAAQDPGRWVVVDGSGSPEEVHVRVIEALRRRLANIADPARP